ncbi:MAG: DNA polymerase III subunit beta [Dehalococcoidia bacterium]
MRISCLQENLSKGLGVVGRAVAARTTLPITSHVLISTEESRLKLSATNLEIAISCWIGAQVEEDGAIAIPAGLLTDFVVSLPSSTINMSVPPDSQSLEITCASSEAHISGQKAEEFPPIPQITKGITAKIDAAALRTAINQVVFAAAVDDSRPVLTGIYAHFSGKNLTLVAADGFRLAVYELALSSATKEELGVIIPARSLREVDRLIRDQEEPVEITVNTQKSQVLFKLKNKEPKRDIEIVSQLIQGTFPDYNQLIPKEHNTSARINVPDFLRVIRSASVFARDGSGIVRLVITPPDKSSSGKIEVSARAEEIGNNEDNIEAIIEGEETKIAFNSKYLMDVFGVLEDDQVILEVATHSSPGVFKPAGEGNWTQVVMPMFVQW